MILDAVDFVFKPPSQVRWARRILIKPYAGYPLPYPITTSRESLETLISSIRRISEADIILLEGNPHAESSMRSIYRALGYDFPGVIALDLKDCVFVEVENPLSRPFALPAFWLPNVLLYCDYLITITPFKVFAKQGSFSVKNLLSLLPASKYQGGGSDWGALYSIGIDKVIADLYFTLPFDLGIIDARVKFHGTAEPGEGRSEDYGKVFVGEPYEVDCEASQSISIVTEYLQLIEIAKAQLANEDRD